MPRKTQSVTKKTTTTTAKSARRGAKSAQPPSIRGEKRIKETGKTVPVGPARRPRGTHDGTTDPAAVDRRKQVTGTDELPARSRNKGGGNAGRPAVGLPGRV